MEESQKEGKTKQLKKEIKNLEKEKTYVKTRAGISVQQKSKSKAKR